MRSCGWSPGFPLVILMICWVDGLGLGASVFVGLRVSTSQSPSYFAEIEILTVMPTGLWNIRRGSMLSKLLQRSVTRTSWEDLYTFVR